MSRQDPVTDRSNFVKTETQDMSYLSLRLKPRLQIGLIYGSESETKTGALYEFKTESETQYMPYSSLRQRPTVICKMNYPDDHKTG